MPGEARLRLDVCCNNPDNGIFASRAEALQVTTRDGEDLEFGLCREHAPRFAELSGAIRFYRRRWPILASKEWYGNWCWNAYWLAPAVLIDLLSIIKPAGAFHCEKAPSQLYDNWNDDALLNRDLWAANLWGQPSIGSADAR